MSSGLYPSPSPVVPDDELYPELPGARHLLSLLELEQADGTFVQLIIPGYRGVSRADGLAGIAVRSVITARSGRHGSANRTRYQADRPVTLTGWTRGEIPRRAWDEYYALDAALADAVDTDRLLRWNVGGRALQALVRVERMEPAVEVGPTLIRYQLTFRQGDPRAYAQTETVVASSPMGTDPGGGLTFPLTWPILFGAGTGGIAAVENVGTKATPLEIVLHGYLRDPVIRLSDTQLLVIAGEVAEGDTLTLDSGRDGGDRTVTLNGDANRIGLLDFERSRWFDLPRGASVIRMVAADFSEGAHFTARFRSAY